MDPITSQGLLFTAALAAGAINAVAGGGSFLTFPALVFTGVPSLIANASSTVALFPASLASAWAYRRRFTGFDGVPFRAMLGVSLLGGLCGALLLLFTPQALFDVVIPWLLAFATLVFAWGHRITPFLQRRVRLGPGSLLAAQYLTALYGGYFGGAVGIIQLSVWTLFGQRDIHAMNASKTLLTGSMNAVAVVCFVIAGKVWWAQTLVMLAGAVAGGYLGARLAQRLDPRRVRAAIILLSVGMTVVFFLRG